MSPRASAGAMSLKGSRTCWTSLIVMPSALKRSRITTSCVEPGQMATRLPFRSWIELMSDFAPAITAMPRLHCAAKMTSGSPAAMPSIAAAMPKVPKSTEPVRTAFLPSVGLSKGMTSIL